MRLKAWIAKMVERLHQVVRSLAPAPQPVPVPVRVRRDDR